MKQCEPLKEPLNAPKECAPCPPGLELPKVFILREQYDKLDPASIRELLEGAPRKVDVEMRREMGKMPRKMKKAYRTGSCYRRDTKWKRKAKAYERRFVYRLPDAEIVVTREQMGVLEATIKGGSLQSNPDAVVSVSGKDIGKKMAAYVRRKQSKGL